MVAQTAIGNAQTPEMIGSLIDILCEDTAIESRVILNKTIKTRLNLFIKIRSTTTSKRGVN